MMSRRKLERLITEMVARRLHLAPSAVDRRTSLHRYGLDTLGATQAAEELSNLLGLRCSAVIFWEHPNVASLARYLRHRIDL